MTSLRSSGLVIAAGTYDGVLAGWEFSKAKKKDLELTFATAVHTGSIRSVSIAAASKENIPGSLLSCGYDEALRTHDWHKRLTSSGEVRTPADFGTPTCSSFAPPTQSSTHCILGFSSGKICIYKKRDWSVQHVLAGHDGGVGSLSVHPTGKLALSGGVTDGKLKLWDLTKGRLAFVSKMKPSSMLGGNARYDSMSSLVWSKDGEFYAMAYGAHITVRDVATGKDLLDVDLPSRVNEVALMSGPEGLFVVAACNDGSLPVLAVEDSDDENRRAIMAIEPVDSHLAREERFKCIKSLRGYFVVTANSAGVVSLMNLAGAVRMITSNENIGSDEGGSSESDEEVDADDLEEDLEMAVDIMDTVRLGTGARITCLTAWCMSEEAQQRHFEQEEKGEEIDHIKEPKEEFETAKPNEGQLGKRKDGGCDIKMDEAAVKKARSLVAKAKMLKEKKVKKKKKKKAKVVN